MFTFREFVAQVNKTSKSSQVMLKIKNSIIFFNGINI